MQIDKTQLETLSEKAVRVLGHELVLKMSPPQQNLLNRALGRLLKEHNGDVASVTPAEIEGQYEQIMYHVLPTGSYEHFLPSKG
jgi:hypothetical protein